MRFREISDGRYCAARKATNVYLITREDSSILIDTGEPSFARPILKALDGFPPVSGPSF
jgi:flavorubredoxin